MTFRWSLLLSLSALGCLFVACGGGHHHDVARDPAEPSAGELVPDRFDEQRPPELVLRAADGTAVTAQQGSSCWGNGCADAGAPQVDRLPDVGAVSTLEAAFPVVAEWWTDIDADAHRGGCASYPVLVEPVDDTHLDLTPSGPAGDRVATYFLRTPEGGDTSGWWRWTVPQRDGKPLAWVSITQNDPNSGGAEELHVYVDDAAVDGEVSAHVTVSPAAGRPTSLALTDVDQHCDGDGFVELSLPYPVRHHVLDSIGPKPYAYAVDLSVGGTTYTGSGSWAPADGIYAGDARLSFDEPLPQRTDR